MGREGRSYFGKIRAIALGEEKGDRFSQNSQLRYNIEQVKKIN
jgi:hypothetical protein